MWFYNMLLKQNGYTYRTWILSTTSPDTFQVSFDKDNIDTRIWQPSSLSKKYLRIAALAMMNLAVAYGDCIQL
jgi:hypothetical protein